MEVLVFKTNVRNRTNIKSVGEALNSLTGVVKWNFDLQDVDRILRIEANDVSPRNVELALHYAGFACEELPD
ncbi:hypothetical protein HHL16_02070 [Pseudoflavitalea sp. G-6-1-2]|uniref:hypothetical protein n=1 Tax=Pseudoflavitalea sp. G-6-1-2 TaxID=2728841 RepID=UPI00146A7E8A|nr:hypothetical protein [Pseudoflavitalea sp. G-6-1-2]NML19636.1 hypothetical protein [Pseudoflavitalea sp. G-6-1-2]